MPINNKVQKLYSTMKEHGADVGTLDEFNKWFTASGDQGYANRKRVYDTFKANGADVGKNYEEFRDWLGIKPVAKTQSKTVNQPEASTSTTTAQKAQDAVKGRFGTQKDSTTPSQPSTQMQSIVPQGWGSMSSDPNNPFGSSNAETTLNQDGTLNVPKAGKTPEVHRDYRVGASKEVEDAKKLLDKKEISRDTYNKIVAKNRMYTSDMVTADTTSKGDFVVGKDKNGFPTLVPNKSSVNGIYGDVKADMAANELLRDAEDSTLSDLITQRTNEAMAKSRQTLSGEGGNYLWQKALKEQKEPLTPESLKSAIQDESFVENTLAPAVYSRIFDMDENGKIVGYKEDVVRKAGELGISAQQFVQENVLPNMVSQALSQIDAREDKKNEIKNTGDYLLAKLQTTVLGIPMSLAQSRQQRQSQQRALGQYEENQMKEGGWGNLGERVLGEAVGAVGDAPLFLVGGEAGKGVSLAGGKLFTAVGERFAENAFGRFMLGAGKYAMQGAGKSVASKASLSAMEKTLAANTSVLENALRRYVAAAPSSAVNLGTFGGLKAGMTEALAGEKPSLASVGKAMLESGFAMAKDGLALPIGSSVLGSFSSKYASSALQRSSISALGFGVEGGTFMGLEYAKDPDNYNVTDSFFNTFGMLAGMKMGTKLTHGGWSGNKSSNDTGSIFNPKNWNEKWRRFTMNTGNALSSKLTPEQRKELEDAFPGKPLEQLVDFDFDKRVKRHESGFLKGAPVRDEDGKVVYEWIDKDGNVIAEQDQDPNREALVKFGLEIAGNKDISWETKQKLFGNMFDTVETNRPILDHTKVDGNEVSFYAKDGQLISKRKFKNEEELDNLIYNEEMRKRVDEIVAKYAEINLTAPDGFKMEIEDAEGNAIGLTPEEYLARLGVDAERANALLLRDPRKLSERDVDTLLMYARGLDDIYEELHPGQPLPDHNTSVGERIAESVDVTSIEANPIVGELKSSYDKAYIVAKALLTQNGATDVDALLKSGDVQTLMQYAQDADQQKAIVDYINASSRYNGFVERTGKKISEFVDIEWNDVAHTGTIDGADNAKASGVMVEVDGKEMMLKDGEVDTQRKTISSKSGMVIVVDPITKDIDFVNVNDVKLRGLVDSNVYKQERTKEIGEKVTSLYNLATDPAEVETGVKERTRVTETQGSELEAKAKEILDQYSRPADVLNTMDEDWVDRQNDFTEDDKEALKAYIRERNGVVEKPVETETTEPIENTVENTVEETTPQSALDLIPHENGKYDFNHPDVTPEQRAAALLERHGDPEKVKRLADNNIKVYKKDVDSLTKKIEKETDSDKLEQHEQKLAEAQRLLDAWSKTRELLDKKEEEVVEEPVTEEEVKVEETEEPKVEEPEEREAETTEALAELDNSIDAFINLYNQRGGKWKPAGLQEKEVEAISDAAEKISDEELDTRLVQYNDMIAEAESKGEDAYALKMVADILGGVRSERIMLADTPERRAEKDRILQDTFKVGSYYTSADGTGLFRVDGFGENGNVEVTNYHKSDAQSKGKRENVNEGISRMAINGMAFNEITGDRLEQQKKEYPFEAKYATDEKTEESAEERKARSLRGIEINLRQLASQYEYDPEGFDKMPEAYLGSNTPVDDVTDEEIRAILKKIREEQKAFDMSGAKYRVGDKVTYHGETVEIAGVSNDGKKVVYEIKRGSGMPIRLPENSLSDPNGEVKDKHIVDDWHDKVGDEVYNEAKKLFDHGLEAQEDAEPIADFLSKHTSSAEEAKELFRALSHSGHGFLHRGNEEKLFDEAIDKKFAGGENSTLEEFNKVAQACMDYVAERTEKRESYGTSDEEYQAVVEAVEKLSDEDVDRLCEEFRNRVKTARENNEAWEHIAEVYGILDMNRANRIMYDPNRRAEKDAILQGKFKVGSYYTWADGSGLFRVEGFDEDGNVIVTRFEKEAPISIFIDPNYGENISRMEINGYGYKEITGKKLEKRKNDLKFEIPDSKVVPEDMVGVKKDIDNGLVFGIVYTDSGRKQYRVDDIAHSTSRLINKKQYDWALEHGAKRMTDAELKDRADENEMNQLLKWFNYQFPHRELDEVIKTIENSNNELSKEQNLPKLKRLQELWVDHRERLRRMTSDGKAYETEEKSSETVATEETGTEVAEGKEETKTEENGTDTEVAGETAEVDKEAERIKNTPVEDLTDEEVAKELERLNGIFIEGESELAEGIAALPELEKTGLLQGEELEARKQWAKEAQRLIDIRKRNKPSDDVLKKAEEDGEANFDIPEDMTIDQLEMQIMTRERTAEWREDDGLFETAARIRGQINAMRKRQEELRGDAVKRAEDKLKDAEDRLKYQEESAREAYDAYKEALNKPEGERNQDEIDRLKKEWEDSERYISMYEQEVKDAKHILEVEKKNKLKTEDSKEGAYQRYADERAAYLRNPTEENNKAMLDAWHDYYKYVEAEREADAEKWAKKQEKIAGTAKEQERDRIRKMSMTEINDYLKKKVYDELYDKMDTDKIEKIFNYLIKYNPTQIRDFIKKNYIVSDKDAHAMVAEVLAREIDIVKKAFAENPANMRIEEVKRMFDLWNTEDGKVVDEDMQMLFDRVYNIMKKSGLKFRFIDNNTNIGGDAFYNGLVQYGSRYLFNPSTSNEYRRNLIIHELLHTISQHALYVARYGRNPKWSRVANVNAEMESAAKEILDIYNALQANTGYGKLFQTYKKGTKTRPSSGDYGTQNEHEMVADIFKLKDRMKKIGLWQKFKDALSRYIFSSKAEDGAEKTDMHTALRNAIDKLLDNFEYQDYKAIQIAEGKKRLRSEGAGAELTVEDNIQLADKDHAILADAIFFHNKNELKISNKSYKEKKIAFPYGDSVYLYSTKNGLTSHLFDRYPIKSVYLNELIEELRKIKEDGTDEFTKKLLDNLETAKSNRLSDSDIFDALREAKLLEGGDGLDGKSNKGKGYISNGERTGRENIGSEESGVDTQLRDKDYVKAVEEGNGVEVDRILKETYGEAMPNSAVVDKDGSLKIVYHNTDKRFNIFDLEHGSGKHGSIFGDGFYFGTNETDWADLGPIQRRFFLNIKNPWNASKGLSDEFISEHEAELAELFGEEWKQNPYVQEKLKSPRGLTDLASAYKENVLEKLGFDGIYYEGGWMDAEQWVALRPEQIKSADIEYNDRDELILPSERGKNYNPDVRYREEEGNGADIRTSEERVAKANDIVDRLGGNGNVVTSVEEVKDERVRKEIESGRNIKGWYDTKTGEVHIYLPNCTSEYDIKKTIFHEKVAHEGLRNLMGEKNFNQFLHKVFNGMDAESKRTLFDLAGRRGWDFNKAIDEYLADKAEDFAETPENRTFWQKVKDVFNDALSAMGLKGASMTENDIRTALWLSKNRLANKEGSLEYKIRKAAFEAKLKKNMPKEQTGNNLTEFAEGTKGIAKESDSIFGINFSEAITPLGRAAREKYENDLKRIGFLWTEAWHNNMESMRILQEAVAGGKDKVKDYANVVAAENAMSSKSMQEQEFFKRTHAMALTDALVKAMPSFDGKDSVERRKGVETYLIAKHGLERNRVQTVRKAAFRLSENSKKRLESATSELESARKELKRATDAQMNAKTESETTIANFRARTAQEHVANAERKVLNAQRDQQVSKDMITMLNTERARLGQELRNGNIKLDEYYTKLDETVSKLLATSRINETISKKLKDADPAVQADGTALKNAFDKERRRLEKELKAGNITPEDYIDAIGKFASDNGISGFHAGGNDKSGLSDAKYDIWSNGDGTYDDAKAIAHVMEMEDKMGADVTDQLWSAIKEATEYSKNHDYQCGLISKSQKETMDNMFDWYVPLRGFDETTAEDMWGYINGSTAYAGTSDMHMKGRNSAADTPIATICAMADASIMRGNRNKMKQAFATLVDENPSDLVTETDSWYEYDAIEDGWRAIHPKITPEMTADQIDAEIKRFNADLAMKVASDPDNYVRQKDIKGDVPFRVIDQNRDMPQHMITVKVNGSTRTFIINSHPRAAQAINGMLADQKSHKVLAKWNNWLSQACTTLDPTFIARNGIRDAEFAEAFLGCTESAKYVAKYDANYLKLVGKVASKDGMIKLFKAYREGTAPTDEIQKYFKEYMDNGGMTGYVQLNKVDRWDVDIDEMVKNLEKGENAISKFMKGYGNALETVGEAIENHTRFATYMTSRQMGRTVQRSIQDAKNVSVNFNRKGAGNATLSMKFGEVGKLYGINRWAAANSAHYLRNYIIFANAGIQGMGNYYKAMKKSPGKFGLLMIATPMAFASAAPLWCQMIANWADNDEDKRKYGENPYAQLPDYERRQNVCIYIGHGKWVKIPLAIELRAAYGMGDILMGQTLMPELASNVIDKERWQSTAEDVAGQLFSQFSQITPVDASSGWKAFVPSAAAPFVDAFANESWTGAPISNKNQYNRFDAQWTKAGPSTNEMMIRFGKGVNELLGGHGEMRPEDKMARTVEEILDPSKLQYILEQETGGLGKMFTEIANFTYNTIDAFRNDDSDKIVKKTWNAITTGADPTKLPVSKAFVKTSNPRNSLSVAKAQYYAYREEAAETKERLKEYTKLAQQNDLYAQNWLRDANNVKPKVARMNVINAFSDAIKEAQTAMNATKDPRQKAVIQEAINQMIMRCVTEVHNADEKTIGK